MQHLHQQMLKVNKLQTGNPVDNGITRTLIERQIFLTYSIPEYYLTLILVH